MRPEERTAHVVMLVGNDVRGDARVKKSALSLHRLGYRVTVVGRSTSEMREEVDLSGVHVVRVPVPWPRRERAVDAQVSPARWWRTEKAARNAAAELGLRMRSVRAWRGSARRRFGVLGAVGATLPAGAATGVLVLARHGARIHRGLLRRWEKRARTVGRRAWRLQAASALDYRDHMVDEVVAQRPDAIHAHDVNMLAVADMAVALLATEGHRVPWVYDAHELVAGISTYVGRSARERAGWLSLERSLAPRADRILTVSPALADALDRAYRPTVPPVVVVNAPWAGEPTRGPVGGVRGETGLSADVPLLVYSGGLTEARGVDTVLESLPLLPEVHLAVIPTPPRGAHLQALVERADELGVGARFHVAAPVPPDQVVDNLASADLGLIPLKRFPSHDVALTNKLFEYLHAGLPVVVSDCPAQAEFVRRLGIGTVHRADDPASVAEAVREALGRRAELAAAVGSPDLVAQWSWQRSESELARVYAELLPGFAVPAEPGPVFPALSEMVPRRASTRVALTHDLPGPVAAALATTGRLTDDRDQADTVLVPVDDDGDRRGGWVEEVRSALTRGQRILLLVTAGRVARPWQAGAGASLPRRLADLQDRAALRSLGELVLTDRAEVAQRIPGAVLLPGTADELAATLASVLGPTPGAASDRVRPGGERLGEYAS